MKKVYYFLKEHGKSIVKYTANILSIANALLLALNEVWAWAWVDKVSGTILAITGVLATYLLGQKAVKK